MPEKTDEISPVLKVNTDRIKAEFGNSFDLVMRSAAIGSTQGVFISIDGMCDELKISQTVIKPLTDLTSVENGLKSTISKSAFKGSDIKEISVLSEICESVISGNLVLLIEGENTAFSFSVQGFAKKSVEEPQSEQNEKGSQEGFTDNFKDNTALLRRRLRTPKLVVEQIKKGKTSNTPVLICYLSDRVDPNMLKDVKNRIEKAELDTVFGSGYLRPFLDKKTPSFFSGTGLTERPDMLAAKISEGRIGIIVDGTPFCAVVPYLFADYFHSLDDYLSSPAYALFIRTLRIICFFVAVTLPGFFVATCLFHPEILPYSIMFDIASAEALTPFSLTTEAITIHLIYEIVREAGLRMPRAIGHAVSIVGALVVGDAAVSAGLIAAPMLIIVALTTVCSSVVSKLHESVAVMRFLFILAGGFMGLYGVFLGIGLMIADMCSVDPYGVPFSAPFSPFLRTAQSDNVLRLNWRKLGKIKNNIGRMKF